MSYSSDLTDEQWTLLDPVFNAPGKHGPKHATDLRRVVDAMLYISHTGCQWRFLPESFGPWTRVWSQFRRWSRNGTWARALTVLHAAAREADGRAEARPSMVIIDTHLARGASNGGFTFHDRGGPYGRTKGAKRVVAVDVTGLPVGALVVPASTHENRASELMLKHLAEQGVTGRLELVLVDRGVTASAARTLGRNRDVEVRRVGWDDKQPVFRAVRHAWRVDVAHGRLRPCPPAVEVVREHRDLGNGLAAGGRIVQELIDAFPAMTVEVARQDVSLVKVFAAVGFREEPGPWFAQLWRQLRDTSDLDQHAIPPGYRIRGVDVADIDDVLARVEVHRRAWAPARIKGLLGLEVTGEEPGSSYSIDKHRAVIETPGYRAELDLVAVGPDGDLAAYALGWLDDRSHSLLFEPVGTDPAHSGRGLARALCARMLRIAAQLGAKEAIVGPRGDPGYPLPRRVYEALGMREVAQFVSMSNTQN